MSCITNLVLIRIDVWMKAQLLMIIHFVTLWNGQFSVYLLKKVYSKKKSCINAIKLNHSWPNVNIIGLVETNYCIVEYIQSAKGVNIVSVVTIRLRSSNEYLWYLAENCKYLIVVQCHLPLVRESESPIQL